MSKLNNLISEYCPNGVPFVRIGDCCSVEKGRTPIQKAVPGDYPLVVTTSERKSSNDYQFERAGVCIPLVSSRGHGVASLNEVFYQEGKYAVGNILCCVIPNDERELSAKFLHLYLNYTKDTLLVPQMKGGANVSLSIDAIARVRVPIPPINVQNEIAKILRTFSDLNNELTAELIARKQQYKYYSGQLLDRIKTNANMVRISELGKWQGGKTPSMDEKSYWENGTIPWISSKDMKAPILRDTQDHITQTALESASMTLFPADSVAIVTRSGILKHTFPVAYVPFQTTVNQDIKILTVREGVSGRYVSLAMQAYGEDILAKTKKQGGTVDSLDFQKVLNYTIPLPEYDVQMRLVEVLDNFESICSDLSIGLPAEIEARQKQYEFYRDQLLTFAATGNTILTDRQTDRAD